MTKTIYILLPVHNRVAITIGFIECLHKQTYKNYKLILVDDGSTDGTAQAVAAEMPSTIILKGNGNLFWAEGLNKGIDWLQENNIDESSIVLLINDDVRFDADFLEVGVGILSQCEKTLLLARFFNKETGEICETGVTADFERLLFSRATSAVEINCLSTEGLFLYWKDMKK